MSDVVIVGTGGHGREMLDVIEALVAAGQPWRMRGFIDDDDARTGSSVRGHRVLGSLEWLLEQREGWQVIIGIGSNAIRARIATRLRAAGASSPVLVHPGASLTPHVELGAGVVICAGAVVTSSVRIGDYSFLNVAASVSHDCELGSFVAVQPGSRLAGSVRVADGGDIGIGASVLQNRSVGEWAVVGGGAVVVDDVPANAVAVGVPARIIRQREPGWQER